MDGCLLEQLLGFCGFLLERSAPVCQPVCHCGRSDGPDSTKNSRGLATMGLLLPGRHVSKVEQDKLLRIQHLDKAIVKSPT